MFLILFLFIFIILVFILISFFFTTIVFSFVALIILLITFDAISIIIANALFFIHLDKYQNLKSSLSFAGDHLYRFQLYLNYYYYSLKLVSYYNFYIDLHQSNLFVVSLLIIFFHQVLFKDNIFFIYKFRVNQANRINYL